MKNIFKLLVACAFATLGFSACQQEEINYNEESATHTVTFIAESPETKTTVDISDKKTAKFAWTAQDEKRFTVYENDTEATSAPGSLSDGKMTVKATFAGSAVEVASYVAVVNKSNNEQIMSAEAYDEDADILVSKAVTAFDGESGVQLQFKREVAIAKMTLKGLDAGEVVNMVTVSSTADIAGSYGVDGWASPANKSLQIASEFYMGEAEGYSIVANEAGEAVVWFTCIPQADATLTVKVEAADGDTYTKEFSKAITLTRGDVKAFGVAMVKDANSAYVLFEGETLVEGDYIIVSSTTTTNTAMVASDTNNDNKLDYYSVEISSNTITTNLPLLEWHIAPAATYGYWTIYNSKAKAYASSTGEKNKAQLLSIGADDKALWSCAKTKDKLTYDFTNKQNTTNNVNKTLRYNSGYGFACYATGTGEPLQLYKKDARTPLAAPQNLSVLDMTLTWSPVEGAAGYRVAVGSVTEVVTEASYTFTGEADYYNVYVIALADENSETSRDSDAATLTDAKFGTPALTTPKLKEGAVDESSVNATWTVDSRATAGYNCEIYNGETKVGDSKTVKTGSVTFDGLDDGVTYTVKVNAIAVEGTKAYAASDVATIDLRTKGTVTLSQITEAGTYTVKNVTVYAVIGTSTAVIGDGTAYFYMYKSSHGLAVGNKFTIGGNVKEYNGILEFDNPTISNKTTGTAPAYENPVEVNEAYLTSYASAPVTEYIHAKGTQSGRNITVGSKKLYLSTNNTATDGKDVEVYGFVYGYNSNSSYAYFYATSIAEDPTAPKLSVTPTSKTWASTETDAAVFTVTTNTEGVKDWSVTPTSLDWATVAVDKDAGTITVTPNGANTAETAREATLTVTHSAGTLSETITLTQKAAGAAADETETIDFESASTAYTFWTFTNMTSKQTGTITAKGGTYYGTTGGKETASITSKAVIATPKSITFYVSRQSTNNTSSSWKIQVSSDNSTWTDVNTQSATSMSKGSWVEVTQDLSSYSNVYVRVYYTGSTAVRNIDDLSLTYSE